jgi:hypothetical protein
MNMKEDDLVSAVALVVESANGHGEEAAPGLVGPDLPGDGVAPERGSSDIDGPGVEP